MRVESEIVLIREQTGQYIGARPGPPKLSCPFQNPTGIGFNIVISRSPPKRHGYRKYLSGYAANPFPNRPGRDLLGHFLRLERRDYLPSTGRRNPWCRVCPLDHRLQSLLR